MMKAEIKIEQEAGWLVRVIIYPFGDGSLPPSIHIQKMRDIPNGGDVQPAELMANVALRHRAGPQDALNWARWLLVAADIAEQLDEIIAARQDFEWSYKVDFIPSSETVIDDHYARISTSRAIVRVAETVEVE